jgi:diacylglycerol kinase (CTP)
MSFPYPIPSTPRVISPSPTPSEASERQDSYFAPVTRSAAKAQRNKSPPAITEEKDGSGSDSSVEKRARTRSRSPVLGTTSQPNGYINTSKRRRMSGLTPKTPVTKSGPLAKGNIPPQENGHLSPYSQIKKSWREFSRSPSPLGLIPLHRHYRYLIHKHEVPRKALHVSIGFFTLYLYTRGTQVRAITPWLFGALVPIASVDLLRHRYPAFNRLYVKCLGALMRETEVDGYNGVIWYLLGTFIALQFFPKDIGVMSVLLLSWCDTAASTFGRLYGRYTIRLRRGKSLAGSLAAWLVGTATALLFWGYFAPRRGAFYNDQAGGFMFQGRLALPAQVTRFLGWKDDAGVIGGQLALGVMSVVTGLIASCSELIDLFGWDDNLTIPLLSSIGMYGILKVFG